MKRTLIIDVRSPEEFMEGAHPEAENIPLDRLHHKVDDLTAQLLQDEHIEIVCCCASGMRSQIACEGLIFHIQKQNLDPKVGDGAVKRIKNGGAWHQISS